MHRQAMLVSLSLSPASNAAKNDKHWAFLEEIDAPQWADLKAEEVLAKAGTIGDDPWFYRSHSHHEVPLTEITGAHAAAIQDSYLNGGIITPNLERKKNRGTSKAKLAFDGPFSAAEKPTEGRFDESPSRADCHEVSFGDSPRNFIASPVHCKSPEQFFPSRRFISSSVAASSDGSELLGISRLRVNMFESQYVHEKVNQSTGPADEPVPSTPSSAAEEGPAKPWQHTFFAKLNDVSRLRKSVGSALRVKVEDTTDNPGTDQTGVTLPKSRLIHQSVQLDPAAERDTTSLKEDTATDVANGSCQSETVRSASKLGINSSVQAFDDIRKMRKSWGSALRVPRVSDEPGSSKLQALEVSPVSDVQSLDETVGDLPSTLLKAIRTSSEEKKQLPSIVRAKERRPAHNRSESVDLVKVERAQERRSAHNRSDSVDLVKVERAKERRAAHNRSESVDLVKLEMDVSSPTVAAAAVAAKKLFRRSVSFDHTPGRGAEPVRSSSSFRSNLSQQRQGSARASPASRLNAPAENLDKASRPVKGGKENTTLQTSTKTTKPNPEASVGSPRMGRQAITRTSMPSLTFAAHARAVMRGGGGGTILKPSGLNTVVESDRSDSSKAAAASAPRKSAVVLDNGARKKTAGCPATAPNPPKMVSRQSILRSSMPVFPASGAKHPSKPATETVTALKSGPKIGGGDPDLAAMLAEHNRKFRAKPKYEPRIHSVKDIREWEARSGQMFYSLLPWEREKANQEISSAKQQTRQK